MDALATPTRRRVLFGALYFSEGAPIGFLWLALPTWLRLAGVPIGQITALTAMLVLPWTFKFVWAPAIDLLRGSRWDHKHWVLAAQSVMALTLAPLLWFDLVRDFKLLVPLLLLHALAAATQDVAIDALCISVTKVDERGSLNGWMQAGVLLGRAMFGGGALIVSERLGKRAVVVLLLVAVLSSLALVIGVPHSASRAASRSANALFGELRAAISDRRTWAGLLFALVGGAAFKSLEVILGPMLVDRGYTKDEIGAFTAGPMIALMIAGSLIGGKLADRLARRAFVGVALLSFVLPIFALAVSDKFHGGARGPHLLLALSATALGIGLFTSASYALYMDLTRKDLAATQFSAFMGATNGCEAWSSYAIGHLIAQRGYAGGLLWMCAASLAALPLLLMLRPARTRKDSSVS